MPTLTVIAESVQGSKPVPSNVGSVTGGAPRDFTVNILSSDWKTVGAGVHELDVLIERSLDAGASWKQLAAAVLQSGPVKGTGLPGFACSWDGQASQVRLGHVLTKVNGVPDVAFSWGLSVTF